MHAGSMSLLGCPGDCSVTSYRTHCYIPVTTSVAFYSSDVSPTFRLGLPSSYQGNLWLLDNCQETQDEAPSCESPNCEPKTCTTSCDQSNTSVPCNSPTVDKSHSACETTNIRANPSCNTCTQTQGYVSDCSIPSQGTSKACQTLSSGFKCFGQLNCLSKSFRPLNHYRLSSLGYRSHQNLGFIPSGFSPLCCIANSCQSPHYFIRHCQYPSYPYISCPPLSYFSRNLQSLSCIPSTFPPLRYLCSGCRPLNCYWSTYGIHSCQKLSNGADSTKLSPSLIILVNHFTCLKNQVLLTSNITSGLNHKHYHLLASFFVALLMPFVLKTDPVGTIIISEIACDRHTEEIPHEIQSNAAFMFWPSLVW